MSLQANLNNIKAKTGKSPEDFRRLAAKKGLVKAGEIVAWLKQDFELGHGQAMAIADLLVYPDPRSVSPEENLDRLFTASKPW
jgi:hypothetical protein